MRTEYCFKKINDTYLVLKQTKHIKDDWVEINKEEKNMSKEELLEELGMSEIEFDNLNKLERYFSFEKLEEELSLSNKEYLKEKRLIESIEEWFKNGNEIDYISIDIEKFLGNKEAVCRFLKDKKINKDQLATLNSLRKQYGYKGEISITDSMAEKSLKKLLEENNNER